MIDYLTDKTYKAGAYVRLSVEDDKKDIESVSITNQRAFIKDYALKNNIEIYDYYVDDGYSGSDFDRPGFKRLINDIENRIINCVITKDMSRLGREFIETGNYVFKYFPENDVRYIAILENYDTLIPNGMDDVLPFKAVINDMYIKDISRKIKSIRHDKMKAGLYVGSSVAYGYKRSKEDNRKFVIDEYAAKNVKRIFEMKSLGMSNCMIARKLTNEGILPPDVYKGKKLNKTTITTNLWKGSSIKQILGNEAYIGNLIQGKYERVSLKSKKKRLLPRSRWIIRKGVIPVIIPQDLFDKVNAPHRKMDIRYSKYDYLLKGLVVCADCGKPMTVRRVKSKTDPNKVKIIYVCRTYAKFRNNVCSMHYYREDALNNIVLKEIRAVLKKYSHQEKMDKKYKSSLSNMNLLDNYQKELANIKSKIITIDKAISELYKDKVNDIIDLNEFTNIKTELEKERREALNKEKDIEIMLGESKDMLTDEKTKRKWIDEFLKSKKPEKEVIRVLVNRIEVAEDKSIKLYFNFNFNEVVNG